MNQYNEILDENIKKIIDSIAEQTAKESYEDQISKYKELISLFKTNTQTCAILGLDIYKYSKFEENKQNLIPYIFHNIYKDTVNDLLKLETIFFPGLDKKDFNETLIETGDGGFQIFSSPLQALIFVLYFESNLRVYNSLPDKYSLEPFVGPITLRYCITYGETFKYNANYYGQALINNSRIISKDSLNRLLIDDKTHKWFMEKVGGVESLQILNLDDISQILSDKSPIEENKYSFIFDLPDSNRFIGIHCLRLESFEMKGSKFDIYDLYLQIQMSRSLTNEIEKKYVITIGNLNTSGI
ncbi:hypothetical protein EHQ19_08465 [Leptospira montravelensis]|uniref:hypothetical protein n=1 Tax=Leptospira montravelensis TaxID=2484961 RepID=UPI00108424A0|nr:hypothetical protein [Leptospira montravelensis]TGK82682.1 hypothetical protein EHQ19_08465 [Leptospira montravelensis]